MVAYSGWRRRAAVAAAAAAGLVAGGGGGEMGRAMAGSGARSPKGPHLYFTAVTTITVDHWVIAIVVEKSQDN